ncbi:MAG: alpha/beta fold hydrolase [Desulfuromonadales bacterium]|nr:alpha/beta fold hydrolase [Desulfuromonadales bacterium]MDT8423196.1 alpha/beta fold hydrolase [Desulfuromonadales bacterium]
MKSFILADGRLLSYRDLGNGPPLIMLHGWTMSSLVFSEVAQQLADDFRVLIPDLRGHGASAPGDGYALADFVADLRQWIAGLGLERCSLLGWSLGGQVACELCSLPQGPVERLVLIATTPRFANGDGWEGGLPTAQVKAMGRNIRRAYAKTMEEFFHLQFAGEALPRERLRAIAQFAVRPAKLPASEVALAALETLTGADQRAQLAQIKVPTLIVHGSSDPIVPIAAGRYLATQLPHADLVTLPGIGHAPFLSRPEEMLTLWREFLS